MTYLRPKFNDPSVKLEKQVTAMFNREITTPVLDYPIPILENFKRSYTRNKPLWVPNTSTDFVSLMMMNLSELPIDADWSWKQRTEFKDWFGIEWVFVPEAGGPMLKPGTCYLDDITNWEKGVRFPNLPDYGIKETAAKLLRDNYADKLDKIFHVDIGLGGTERLVSVLGGYTEAMLAMALEPDAVRDFLFAHSRFCIDLVDLLCDSLPLAMITYHDDWGTERDTFFSEKMMEDIVFEPTKLLFDHIKSKDLCLQLHSCGKIERFIPYMIDLNVDYMQIQRRANNSPLIKQKFGHKIGINTGIEGLDIGASPDKNTLINAVRNTVDIYAPLGGFYSAIFTPDPELAWDATMELFYYSREFYEQENASR